MFDSSALLAYLKSERGRDLVREKLVEGGRISTANWSEVVQKVLAVGRSWAQARGLLLDYDLILEPVSHADAELAARWWDPTSGLSLADRLCLATAERLDALVWTADAAWGTGGRVRQIR